MATKPTKTPGRIPTVAELMENPSIRALADRWNRSAVVSGVRTFLDDLQSSLAKGDKPPWTSIRELTERAARFVVFKDQISRRAVINATGQFWGEPWAGRPQSDAALERAFAVGREFVANPEGSDSAFAEHDVETLLCHSTGASAAVAVHSYVGGIWLALSSLAAGREVIVARGQVGTIGPSCSLTALVDSAGATLREVGSTNQTTAADYEAAITPQTSAILRLRADDFCVIGDTESSELDELVALTRDRELTLIDALGSAPLVDLTPQIALAERSVRSSLAQGVQLTIARGDGLAGGPACGILAGDAETIGRIIQHPLFASSQLDPPRAFALAETLRYDSARPEREPSSPLWELISTPIENLRNRAERLAPQLAHSEGIRSAEAVAMLSHCDNTHAPDRALPSFGIALTPVHGDPSSLAQRLATASWPVIGRIEAERVLLDLRTVLPRHDPLIVRALVGESTDGPHDASSQPPLDRTVAPAET
jgi:L-seryl-tRNA(Ser) seleniumtransferase